MKRHGFALLAALWVMTGLAVLGLAAMLAAREAVATARNRIALTRAAWLAEGCAEHTRAAIDDALRSGSPWGRLADNVPLATLQRFECTGKLTPSGYALDVNHAGAERLARLFRASGVRSAQADSLVHALLDWRDADEAPLPLGAESPWYRARHMLTPRNAAFGDASELRFVRGIAESGRSDLLGTEPGRTPVNLAPLPVVASLPGMSWEVVNALEDRRRRRVLITDLAQLAQGVSTAARDTLLGRFAELAALATVDPEAWVLEVAASDGTPPVKSSIQLRLAPGPTGAVVVRRKTW